MTGPGVEQGAVDGEVLIGEETALLRDPEHLVQQRVGDVARQESIPILGEDGRDPDGIVDPKPDKPAEEQIVAELLHELALAADRIEHLE